MLRIPLNHHGNWLAGTLPFEQDNSLRRSRLLYLPKSSFPWLLSISFHIAVGISLFCFSSGLQLPLDSVVSSEKQSASVDFYQVELIQETAPIPIPKTQEQQEIIPDGELLTKQKVLPQTKVKPVQPQRHIVVKPTDSIRNNVTSPLTKTIEDSKTDNLVGASNSDRNEVHRASVKSISSWINKHKYYPLDARRNNEQGVVLLKISLNRNGGLDHYAILKSSGSKSLDRAATDIIKRAAPFPNDVVAKINQLEVPLVFSLRS